MNKLRGAVRAELLTIEIECSRGAKGKFRLPASFTATIVGSINKRPRVLPLLPGHLVRFKSRFFNAICVVSEMLIFNSIRLKYLLGEFILACMHLKNTTRYGITFVMSNTTDFQPGFHSPLIACYQRNNN